VFIVLPIALGFFLIWYSLSKLQPEDIVDIKHSFKTANYFWVALSLFLGGLSHVSRAIRWQYMLTPMGYTPKFVNRILSVFVSYFLNLTIPRSGEIARATTISKYEDIPFDKAFGTIVAERIADVIMLLLIIFIAFLYQADLIKEKLFSENSNPTKKLLILGGIILVFWLLYKYLSKSKNKVVLKIKGFINGLKEGVLSIFKMEKKGAFIFHTLFIWTMYVLMFYVVTFAIPETKNLPFEATIVGFVIGAISMALTNGGLGVYPAFVAGVLTLYHVSENAALAFGWIMWTAQTVLIIISGGLSLLFLPLINKDN